MAIQIIDNFNLSVAKPIDDRFVVGSQSFYTNRNNIPYKYKGLRIWDLNDGVPYVWNGTTWVGESSVSISGSGNANYVPKFIGSGVSNTIGQSSIYVSGASVGINNTSITAGYILDIIGGVRSQGATGFSGVGSLLTSLNATQITSGAMSLARLANNNTSGWIITSGVSQPGYTNPANLTVGAASASVIFNETSNSNVHYVGFFNAGSISGSGTYQSRVSVVNTLEDVTKRQLTYKPSTGNLTSALITTGTFSVGSINSTSTSLVISLSGVNKFFVESAHVNFGTQSTGTPRISLSASPTAALPSYTWYGDPNTGMYRPSADTIGFSTNGVERMKINNDGIQMIDDSSTTSGFIDYPEDHTFSNSSGTYTNSLNISSQVYDRQILALIADPSVSVEITNGSAMGWEVKFGGQTVLVSHSLGDIDGSGGDNMRKWTPKTSFSFILPAGISASIGYTTNAAVITNGTFRVFWRGYRFGK